MVKAVEGEGKVLEEEEVRCATIVRREEGIESGNDGEPWSEEGSKKENSTRT